jgi:hypothetical protein
MWLTFEEDVVGWQPIETAPKGECALVYRNGEIFSAVIDTMLLKYGGEITHWMPLPEPPAA